MNAPLNAPLTSPHRSPLAYARRMIGPDSIKVLREFALSVTGNKFAFDTCRVQRSPSGKISWRIQPDLMEELGEGHPETYGAFLRNEVIPQAERLERYLKVLPEEERVRELDNLVRRSLKDDGFTSWLLSSRATRRLLFPAAYNPKTGMRWDNVIYHHRPKDYHATKTVLLRNLRPETAADFADYASKMTDRRVNPDHVTPVTLSKKD